MMATAATQELLPLEGSTSAVWKHFGFPSKDGIIIVEKKKRDRVYCNCGTKLLSAVVVLQICNFI